MLFFFFCLSICLGPWYEKAPVVRYPILFAAAEFNNFTYSIDRRLNLGGLATVLFRKRIFGRNKAKVEEGNFRSL